MNHQQQKVNLPIEGIDDEKLYLVPEVAMMIDVSKRWLFDQCRAGKVEHVYLARKRKFTGRQVWKLIRDNTVIPEERTERDRQLEHIARKVVRPDTGSRAPVRRR
jgi:hypothetical protein